MQKIIEVKPRPEYKLWVRFADGVEGEADLSHLVGKGVFSVWNDYAEFEKVRIGAHGELLWEGGVDLCPDAVYLQITGKTPEELFPKLNESEVNA
jgi:hypothetical protein